MSSDEPPFSDIEATLKKAAAALREADVPFLLGGSLASWARGGPETRHDLDLMIKHEDVERALAALPPEFRAAVVLCDVEGLTYDEIADVLGVKLGTVRSRIHRGRAQLRAALKHRTPVPGRRRVSGPVEERLDLGGDVR